MDGQPWWPGIGAPGRRPGVGVRPHEAADLGTTLRRGRLQADVAAGLGLSPDVIVVSGVPDAHSVALGSGAVLDHQAHLSLGTTSWVSCHVPEKKTDVVNQVAAVPSCLPGRYLVVNNHETSGRCLHWARDVLDPGGHGERVPFDALTELAGQAPTGSGGVVLTPWLAGEQTPIADRHTLAGSTTCRCPPPGRTWCGPCWKGSP